MMYKRHLNILIHIALMSVFFYFFARLILLMNLMYTSYVNIILTIFLFLAETHIMIHTLGFLVNVFRLSKKHTLYHFKNIKENEWPRVDVLIPIKEEPYDVLHNTITTVKSMDYPNFKIFLLDGSQKSSFIQQNKKQCKEFDIEIFYPSLVKGKAGTVNEFLKGSQAKYVAIFDADQNPMPSFLREVVSIAEYNKKIAFVQTPQLYSNLHESNIAMTAAMQQSVFYESICESKASVNAMFCCGTNVLLNLEYLTEVGGFDEASITEDFSTSLNLHLAGYKSIYYNHVRVFGMAPETLPAYFKQQARWAKGTAGVLKKVIMQFFTHFNKLSLAQWWEYILSGSYYLIGWSFLILMICPIMFLIFNVPTYNIGSSIYILIFLPYYVMSFIVFYSTMKVRGYHFKDVYTGIVVASLSFPVLIQAVTEGFFGLHNTFVVTPKSTTTRASTLSLWPWMFMITLNIIAVVIGVIKLRNDVYAYAINLFWCIYHIFILFHIFTLNKIHYVGRRNN